MEEAMSALSLSDLALEGQKQLEASINAAHQILESLHQVLNNPSLWAVPASATPSQPPMTGGDALGGVKNNPESRAGGGPEAVGVQQLPEPGWAALDDARLMYRSSTAALRAVLTAIFTNPQMKEGEEIPANLDEDKKDDQEDIEKLEQRVSKLREEVIRKNLMMSKLIGQLRELITNLSMWQSPNL